LARNCSCGWYCTLVLRDQDLINLLKIHLVTLRQEKNTKKYWAWFADNRPIWINSKHKSINVLKNSCPLGPGSNKPPDTNATWQKCDKKKIQKKSEHDLSHFLFSWMILYCYYHMCLSLCFNFKGPGKHPELVLRDPFGKMMTRKNTKKSENDLSFIFSFGWIL